MNSYGETAIKAVQLYASNLASSPRDAWEEASTSVFGLGTPSQRKGCPRDAFLGLCEAGLVTCIPAGNYTRSVKNKQYAIDAVKLLRSNSEFTNVRSKLWQLVEGNRGKVHNSQMDVVIALWTGGFITTRNR